MVLRIEGSVTHSYDPWPERPVLRFVSLFQIPFQPFVLIPDLFSAVLREIMEFSGKGDDMRRSHVIAPEVVVYLRVALRYH